MSARRELLLGAGAGLAAGCAASYLLWRALNAHTPSAADAAVSTTSSSHDGRVYETDKAVQEYLLFHFGKPEEILPYAFGPHNALDFSRRTAELCLTWRQSTAPPTALPLRVLDVGCAVGGSCFAFSAKAEVVVGVDFSQRFVDAAEALRKGGELPYTYTVEGDVTAAGLARVPAGSRCDRVRFLQGDACALPTPTALGGPFDIVHGANLLCRLPNPRAFLAQLPALVAPGGLAIFISPYSWLPQYTPPDKWLGGRGGVRSRDVLVEVMASEGFTLLGEDNTPFLIREHARKFQWGCSHVTVFQRQ